MLGSYIFVQCHWLLLFLSYMKTSSYYFVLTLHYYWHIIELLKHVIYFDSWAQPYTTFFYFVILLAKRWNEGTVLHLGRMPLSTDTSVFQHDRLLHFVAVFSLLFWYFDYDSGAQLPSTLFLFVVLLAYRWTEGTVLHLGRMPLIMVTSLFQDDLFLHFVIKSSL